MFKRGGEREKKTEEKENDKKNKNKENRDKQEGTRRKSKVNTQNRRETKKQNIKK